MAKLSEKPRWETTTQAARRYGVSPRTLLRWLQAGVLRGVQTAGGHWRIQWGSEDSGPPAGAPPQAVRESGPGLRIVLVEDEEHHAAAFARLIRLLQPSATVDLAVDGLSAGLLLGTVLPHAVFVDLELPGLDGIEVIRRAERHPALTHGEFIVVSGHLSPDRISMLASLNVRHILSKPISPEPIRAILDDISSRRETRPLLVSGRMKEAGVYEDSA